MVHYRVHKSSSPVPVLSQTNPVQILNPISKSSILVLCIHVRLGLASALFPSGFPTNNLYSTYTYTNNVPVLSYKLEKSENLKPRHPLFRHSNTLLYNLEHTGRDSIVFIKYTLNYNTNLRNGMSSKISVSIDQNRMQERRISMINISEKATHSQWVRRSRHNIQYSE
jgi:hypothetical protein